MERAVYNETIGPFLLGRESCLEARIIQAHDITVVKLKGFLDFEIAETFRKNCLENLSGYKVIFNLRELSFVGSSGITPFVEMLSQFSKSNNVRPKFCEMTSEFRRLFLSSQINDYEIFEDELGAMKSFTAPPAPVAAVIEAVLPAVDHLVQK
jgi:anti-anti-sigma factor